jgi:hypothetical protein
MTQNFSKSLIFLLCLILIVLIIYKIYEIYKKENYKNKNIFYKDLSKIHGYGIFSKNDVESNKKLFKVVDKNYNISELGKYVNHSYNSNSYLNNENNEWFLYSSNKISPGEEVVANYDKNPWFLKKSESWYVK